MADFTRRDAFLGLLTKLIVDNASGIPTALLELELHVQLVVVPRQYAGVLARKLQEMSVEVTALEIERTNKMTALEIERTNKETIN